MAPVSLAGLAVTVFFLPEPKGQGLEEISAEQDKDNASGRASNAGRMAQAG